MWRHGCSCIYIQSLSADVEDANVYTCKCLPRAKISDSMMAMSRQITKVTTGPKRGRLSPCVCNTLRMVSRVVTQLYDDCLRSSGLRVTQFSILAAVARLGEARSEERRVGKECRGRWWQV